MQTLVVERIVSIEHLIVLAVLDDDAALTEPRESLSVFIESSESGLGRSGAHACGASACRGRPVVTVSDEEREQARGSPRTLLRVSAGPSP
jgi:hypothetical protein